MEQELKAGYIDDFYCEFYESGMPMAYLKDEVDDVLAEKDAEIRRLQRALWIAHEYKAKFKRWWLHLALDCEAREIRPDTKTINRIREKIGNCEKSERKCRAKAEEFR